MAIFRGVKRAVQLHHGEDDLPPDRWQNRDLVPLPPSRRQWRDLDFIGLWSTVFLTIYGWQATSSVLSYGLNVRQSVLVTIIARAIQLGVVLALSWVGGVWHISYTVQSRYTFGIWGSLFPILLRVAVTCVLYGIQAFTGGLLISTILSTIFPSFQSLNNTMPASASMTTKQFVGFILYNVIAIRLLYFPPDKLRVPLRISLAISGITIFGLSIGLMIAAGGVGSYVKTGTTVSGGSELGWAFVHGITTLIGGNAVGMTSQADFSRFARRPKNQLWGQTIGIMIFGVVVPVFRVLGTSAAGKIYGDVVELALGLLCNILALNSVENGVSGGMDFAGLWPKYINIRHGSYLIAVVSVLLQPWQILAKASTFTAALSSFGIILSPMMDVFTADYYLVRKRKLKLGDLYHPNPTGIYYFFKGVNLRSYASWILGFAPSIGGMASLDPKNNIPIGLTRTFYTGFITGYAISFLSQGALSKVFPPAGLGEIDDYDTYGTFSLEEARKLGIQPQQDQLDGQESHIIEEKVLEA